MTTPTVTIKQYHIDSGAFRKLHILSDELIREISELNGSDEDKIRKWLLEGSRVYTTFSCYERETLEKQQS